ncbi:hypothetical protein [Dyadobacter sp. LHD-138]|uniref:hypothetical protein n=1 Tax=Dyadobacter sp. LHD-138 TaxID=3071413 RepID=UPI0027E0C846|nr:hypothetical protein [Dyadobacter sp. LHD-138]MDQ6479557.1 hypothetical protein [Dyadobacter sp. LHD-138]
MSETKQELARLRKELRDTQLERDILKKAVGGPPRGIYPLVIRSMSRKGNCRGGGPLG